MDAAIARETDAVLADSMRTVKSVPTAIWLDSIKAIAGGFANGGRLGLREHLDQALARGDTSGATGWLRETVQRHGGLRKPRDTIAAACGFEPSEAPLLDYLEAKFSALYRL